MPMKFPLPVNPVDVMGLHFPNPIGLAAGFDRDGKFLCCSEPLGFGFIEIGTINVDSQKDADNKLINIEQNLGKASRQYKDRSKQQQWGVSLGSLRNTVDGQTVSDYTQGMKLFWKDADYFVINLSRPDSPARALKPDMEDMDELLQNIKQQHSKLTANNGKQVPVVIKIAVDYINNKKITDVLLLAKDQGFDGAIIAFEDWPNVNEISECVRTFKASIDSFPFIVVGGIRSTKDARQILYAGASLVQIYTGLVQRGPLQTRKMITDLSDFAEKM